MNITEESSQYSLMLAKQKGVRDGKDCALLEKPKVNPYVYGCSEYYLYDESWEEGFQDESSKIVN